LKLRLAASKFVLNVIPEGAFGWDHTTISVGSSDPEAPGKGIKMKGNDVVRLDMGAIYKGYCSDVSRHVVLDEVPQKVREAFDVATEVQQACVDAIQPGTSFAESNKIALEACRKLSRRMPVFPIGHSVGIQTEEFHFIHPLQKASDRTYRENMVLDIEVWVPFPPFRAIGNEDTYIVTRSGCKRISKLEQDIFVK